ncbi:MAG: DMT family transporter [Candidatus Cloacimonadota bacterium]|nr:MAG: DMT family transporter [Candidatus Cloacimonadota bacterium]
MKKQKQAYIYAIIAVLFWSTVASAFKVSLRYVDVFQLLFFSSLSSVIILFIILFIQNKLKLLRTYEAKDFLRSALLGFLNPFLYYIVLFNAYSLLRAQEALTLNYTWPIMLALLSIPILKQKIGFRSILAIFISFLGAFIIATKGNIISFKFTNILGVLLALGSTVIWSLFWIYNIKDKRDYVAKLFLNFVFGFIFILIAAPLFSKISIPDMRGLFGAGYVGLFEMGITFVFWLKALQLSRTTAKVANLIYLSPFISLIIINRIVGENILVSTVIGLILIVTGIIVQQYTARTRVSS